MRYPNLSLSTRTLIKLKELEREVSEIYMSLVAPEGTGKYYISVYGSKGPEFMNECDAEFYGDNIYGEEYAIYQLI
jgi:hypothetical protein